MKGALAVGIALTCLVCADAQVLLTDWGAAPPTPGPDDVAQLSVAGNVKAPDGLNYYTDNAVSYPGISTAGQPGQTFTTGANPAGYLLTTVAIKTAGLNSYYGIGTNQNYRLQILSVFRGTATSLNSCTGGPITFADGDWLQWSGLSVPLAVNSVYAYSFGRAASGVGWEALSVADDDASRVVKSS